MRRYLDNEGSYVISKVNRTVFFDTVTGETLKNVGALVHVTIDELKFLATEAEKRYKKLNLNKKVSSNVVSRIDSSINFIIDTISIPRLKGKSFMIEIYELMDFGKKMRKTLDKIYKFQNDLESLLFVNNPFISIL